VAPSSAVALEPRRKAHAPDRARNDELAVLERLAQRLQGGTLELRELIQQQHTEMPECSRMSLEVWD
jgi:hypothetical protein